MPQLKSFISASFRPEIHGATLDKTHETRFLMKKKNVREMTIHAICFGPKKDRVLVNLEQSILSRDKTLVLYYEDIHKRWTYVKTQQKSYFVYQKNQEETLILYPSCLYIRGCYIPARTLMWKIIGHFYTFTNCWPGRVLCAPQSQCSNESKPHQLHHALRKAAKGKPAISIGTSYIVKGDKAYERHIKGKNCIVKSLSGIRSIVVDEAEFSAWHRASIQNLPVLFQKQVKGNDLRVHIIQKQIFAKRSSSKENIDYRYDKNFFQLEDIHTLPSTVKLFAYTTSQLEGNQLMGIDFIQSASKYVVLEANPSPGWSAYHESHGINGDPFIKALINTLKNNTFNR